MRSDEINELAAALAKAQSEIKSAAKDAKNPHFNSTYATLSSVWDAIRAPLSKNGLAVTQLISETEAGPLLETTLIHSSGQWLQSEMLLRPNKNDMQGFGSALTYARKYCLSAIVGVAPDDDDDGNAASEGKPAKQMAKVEPPRRPRETTPTNGTAKSAKLNVGQQKFYDSVQQATGGYYKDPAHLLNVVDWPNFSDQDSVGAALSQAVDHWREKTE